MKKEEYDLFGESNGIGNDTIYDVYANINKNISQCRAIPKNTLNAYFKFKGSYDQGTRVRAIVENYHSGDPARMKMAQYDIVIELYNYVLEYIAKCAPTFQNERADLIQESCAAISEKLKDFNPDLGTATTFFSSHIKHVIFLYTGNLTNHDTSYYSSDTNKVTKAIREMESKGFVVTVESVATYLDMPYKQVETCMNIIHRSTEVHYENFEELEPYLNDFNLGPEAKTLQNEQQNNLANALMKIPKRSLQMFEMYNGINGNKMSYTQIASLFGTNAGTVSKEVEQVRMQLMNDKNLTDYRMQRRHRVKESEEIPLIPEIEDTYDVFGDEGDADYIPQNEKHKKP